MIKKLEALNRAEGTQQVLVLLGLRGEVTTQVRQFLGGKRSLTGGFEELAHTRGNCRVAVRNGLRRLYLRKLRIDDIRDAIDEAVRPGFGKVRQHDDREIIAEVAGNVGSETLPRSAVAVPGFASRLIEEPT